MLDRLVQIVKMSVSTLIGIVLVIYLLGGAAWYLSPYFVFSCPLNVNSHIVRHDEGWLHDAIAWATWPLDVQNVEREAARRGVAAGDVRYEDFCPSDSASPQ